MRRLVSEGRLEFIGGGWSMNDEASAHYSAIVDNMASGFHELREHFGKDGAGGGAPATPGSVRVKLCDILMLLYTDIPVCVSVHPGRPLRRPPGRLADRPLRPLPRAGGALRADGLRRALLRQGRRRGEGGQAQEQVHAGAGGGEEGRGAVRATQPTRMSSETKKIISPQRQCLLTPCVP